jgi:hypothetical protein
MFDSTQKVKKDKVHPITCDEGPEAEWGYSSAVPLTVALDGGG